MTVNLPGVLAELQELYPRYEQALVNNDVDTRVAMFWAGPQVLRFGVAENLYGPEPGWGDLLHMISVPLKNRLIFGVSV